MIDLNDALPASPIHYDLPSIVAGLRTNAESWVPSLFPNGRREGEELRLANIKGDAPRKAGSCVITLKGEHAGDWHDFDGGQGGGPLSAIEQATGLSGRLLFAEAAEIAGWTSGPPARQAAPAAAKPERNIAREIDLILERAVPLAGTLGETYLGQRGLTAPASSDLLFHPDLVHWETRTGYPGLVGVVRDVGGAAIAVHRTYLRPDGSAKADVAKSKMMLGPVATGAVRLAPIGADGVLGIAEGIETALAVMTARPGLPVWAALSTAGMEQIQLPPEAKRIALLADHDASGAGMRAAEATARRLVSEGREIAIALPPQAGDDFNDLLLRDGPDAVARCVARAVVTVPVAATSTTDRHNRPVGFADPIERLPVLRADDGDLERAVRRGWDVLLGSNALPWLFRAGGVPSWVVADDEGRPVAVPITDERLRHMLAKLAAWRRSGRNGELVPAHPPTALVKSLLATPDPGLPVLTGIVGTPVFGRGGVLLTEPGYHPDARLLYQPVPGFALPPIPQKPSAGQVAAARSLILDDLFGEFPFTGPAERAHVVALLLLGFLRAMVDGPTPLHLIEKPTPGTGATLMVDAIATVLTGAGAAVMTEGRDDEEWRKRITAKLRQIPVVVLIDNLRHPLDASALAAALTAPFWEDRVLGLSEMTRLPIRCIWIATGNNPEFSNEMARRLVRIRLDARVDQPWRRAGFRHADLMGWVRANRAGLVAACLTLCQAWIEAGRPLGQTTIGSYESWSRVLGGVLGVAGIEGFLGNIDEMLEASDGESAIWRGFVASWWDRFGTADAGSAALYELACMVEPPLPLGVGGDHSRRTRLGKALGRMRDRVYRLDRLAVRVEACGLYKGAVRWRLTICDATTTESPSPPSPRGTDLERVVRVGEGLQSDPHRESGNAVNRLNPIGEGGEGFSNAYACAGAREIESAGKTSPPSSRSPTPGNPRLSGGEGGGEGVQARSPLPNPPAWLEDVP